MSWNKYSAQQDRIVYTETVDGLTLAVTIEAITTRGADRQPRMRLSVEPPAGHTRAQSAWLASTIPQAWESWGKEFH